MVCRAPYPSVTAVTNAPIQTLLNDFCPLRYCVPSSVFATVLYLHAPTQLAVLRCNRDYYEMAWSAVTTMSLVRKKPCMINCIKLSGMLTDCKRPESCVGYEGVATSDLRA